jgi:NAD(P)-dependent dehydrogenase (short-subunit alcohol dehydrogenase family)
MITGASSGIGLGLARELRARGFRVLCMQRRATPLAAGPDLVEVRHDLTHFEQTRERLAELLRGTRELHCVILSSGVAADLADLSETPLDQIQRLMDINVWSNKVLIDALLEHGVRIRQVVGISSGAAVNGHRGWNGYSLSKATFVMLLKLYAAERPDVHFSSLAPGLVQTAMQDALCGLDAATVERFPSVARLIAARGTEQMPTPDQVAGRLLEAFERVRSLPSGSFTDIRQMTSPEAQG